MQSTDGSKEKVINISLHDNKGIKAVWSVSALVLTILFIYLLQSLSYMWTAPTIQVLQYLTLTFGIISILLMW